MLEVPEVEVQGLGLPGRERSYKFKAWAKVAERGITSSRPRDVRVLDSIQQVTLRVEVFSYKKSNTERLPS